MRTTFGRRCRVGLRMGSLERIFLGTGVRMALFDNRVLVRYTIGKRCLGRICMGRMTE